MFQYLLTLLAVATLPATSDRIGVGYDCTDQDSPMIPGDCLTPSDLDDGNAGVRPWPDWESSDTYFGRWRGYTVNAPDSWEYEKYIAKSGIVATWLELRPGLQRRPVLALVGGRIFVLSSRQIPFYNTEKRRCPSCVEFVPVSEADDITRELIALRLASMLTAGDIPDSDGYDTILYYKDPREWSDYAPGVELAVIVGNATHDAADLAPKGFRSTMHVQTILQFGQLLGIPIPATATRAQRATRSKAFSEPYHAFIRDFLLSPHDLGYKRMVGPSPELKPYAPIGVEPRTPWRRLVDKELRKLGYTDNGTETALEQFRRVERWDPMGSSVMAMQYFRPTRNIREARTSGTYWHMYGVSEDPGNSIGPGAYSSRTVAIYEDENRRRLAELSDTNAAINKLLGTDISLDQLFGRSGFPD